LDWHKAGLLELTIEGLWGFEKLVPAPDCAGLICVRTSNSVSLRTEPVIVLRALKAEAK